MMLYICVKFHQNIHLQSRHEYIAEMPIFNIYYILHGRNGFVKCSKGNISKIDKTELWFMYSACRLIVLYTCVKFHKNISNGFQLG